MDWKIKRDSFSKMIVWFADGNVRTMYSLDWTCPQSKTRDAEIGLSRFQKLVARYGAKARAIEIYTCDSGTLIEKYVKGKKVETP